MPYSGCEYAGIGNFTGDTTSIVTLLFVAATFCKIAKSSGSSRFTSSFYPPSPRTLSGTPSTTCGVCDQLQLITCGVAAQDKGTP